MIRRQVLMPVSPEQLWEVLTDPGELSGWFGGQLEWDLTEGGPVRYRGDGGDRDGRVEAVRPGRHLRFRWWPADESDDDADGASEVSYVLEPAEDGTRLTIQERRVPTGPQACAAGPDQGTGREWTPWDSRLVGAWAGLVGAALEGVRA